MSSQFARLRGALDRVGTTTPGTIVGVFAEDLTAIMNHYVEVVREAAELKAARAQPAQAGQVLSDEDVLRAAARTLDSEVVEVSPLSCIKDFARAIEAAVLAKRVPMTPEETDAAMKLLFYPARNRAFIDGVEAAELHHGIVGEKGGAT